MSPVNSCPGLKHRWIPEINHRCPNLVPKVERTDTHEGSEKYVYLRWWCPFCSAEYFERHRIDPVDPEAAPTSPEGETETEGRVG